MFAIKKIYIFIFSLAIKKPTIFCGLGTTKGELVEERFKFMIVCQEEM